MFKPASTLAAICAVSVGCGGATSESMDDEASGGRGGAPATLAPVDVPVSPRHLVVESEEALHMVVFDDPGNPERIMLEDSPRVSAPKHFDALPLLSGAKELGWGWSEDGRAFAWAHDEGYGAAFADDWSRTFELERPVESSNHQVAWSGQELLVGATNGPFSSWSPANGEHRLLDDAELRAARGGGYVFCNAQGEFVYRHPRGETVTWDTPWQFALRPDGHRLALFILESDLENVPQSPFIDVIVLIQSEPMGRPCGVDEEPEWNEDDARPLELAVSPRPSSPLSASRSSATWLKTSWSSSRPVSVLIVE